MAWTEIQVPSHPETTLHLACFYEGGRSGRYRVDAHGNGGDAFLDRPPIYSVTYDYARWMGHCAGQLLMPEFVSAAEKARVSAISSPQNDDCPHDPAAAAAVKIGYAFKDGNGKWVPGFLSRIAALDAALATGLAQVETAALTAEAPAYFARFFARPMLEKMVEDMRRGEQGGRLISSSAAQKALLAVFETELTDPDFKKVLDLMNRLQTSVTEWLTANGYGHLGFEMIDTNSIELHVKGTGLNVPIL